MVLQTVERLPRTWEDKEMFPKTQEDQGKCYMTKKEVMMMFPMTLEAGVMLSIT